MKEIKTPLRYPGGKSRAAEKLVDMMPYFVEYREPFLGGGSVFLKTIQRYPDRKYWINDLYYDLYCFWFAVQNHKDAVISAVNRLKEKYSDGKELYNYLVENIFKFEYVDKAAAFFILNRITFSGTILSGGYSQGSFDGRFTDSSIKRIDTVSPLLTNVNITNLDYSVIFDTKSDNKHIFYFLDPPYYSSTKSALYGINGELHKGFDHDRFFNFVKDCKDKWMITYDDCEYIREKYKDYYIFPLEFSYGMKNVSPNADMKGKEIIITNY